MSIPVRLRAIIPGLFLGVILSAATPINDVYLGGMPLSGGHFPLAPFFISAWIFIFCALYQKMTGRILLNGTELIVIWAFMLIVSGIGYSGLVRTFFINISAPDFFTKDGYDWSETLKPLIPGGWYPSDPQAVDILYNGLENGRNMGWFDILAAIPWHHWISPLLHWGFLIALSYFLMVCMVSIFSRQWIVNERVNFPLFRVPQLMGEAYDEGRFFSFLSNRFLIMGILCTVFLHTLDGLNFYYPAVPELPRVLQAGHYFPKYGLFSGFHKLKISIYPAFIGFAYLTTRQISFSMWFFYLFGCLLFGILYVFGLQFPESALGVTFGPTLSRPEEGQIIGCYLIYFLFMVWLARRHLLDGIASSFGRRSGPQGAPVWALWGFSLGMVALMGLCYHMGISPGGSILLPLAFFFILLVISRLICQGGLPYFTLTAAPSDGLTALFGSSFFGRAGLLAAAVIQKILYVDVRESLMPSLFHQHKASENASNRPMIHLFVVLALVLAVVVSFCSLLAVYHKFGIRDLSLDWATTSTHAVYENAQKLMTEPSDPNQWLIIFAIAGGVAMTFLVVMYYRFSWWPIHPLGYLAMYMEGMRMLWFCFLIGWLANHLCLRYGGTALFKKVRFFFIGLILGDFLMAGIWAVAAISSGSSYNIFPT